MMKKWPVKVKMLGRSIHSTQTSIQQENLILLLCQVSYAQKISQNLATTIKFSEEALSKSHHSKYILKK